jgi:antitoxin (DNA-binding transcriptional repressor) of toxin-antitoxin stability system
MSAVSLFEAKTHLSRLVEALDSGREREILISRRGRPVVRMEAVRGPDASRRIGVARGDFVVPADIDRANPKIAALFAGRKASA